MDAGIGYFSPSNQNNDSSGLGMFSKQPALNLFARSKYIIHKPLQALSATGPYSFEIGSRTCKDLIPLKSLRLNLKVKITKDEDAEGNITDDSNVSIVNTFGHSLFENISVKINGVVISDHNRLYGFKSYIQQTYSYSSAVKTNNLNCEYFIKDQPADDCNVKTDCNGFKTRA